MHQEERSYISGTLQVKQCLTFYPSITSCFSHEGTVIVVSGLLCEHLL